MKDFADIFANAFADAVLGEGFRDSVARIRRQRGGMPPAVKVCKDRKELGDWFTDFAKSCRGALGGK